MRWLVRRFNLRFDSISDANSSDVDPVEQIPVVSMEEGVGTMHGCVYSALLTEEGLDWAYALIGEDVELATSYYVLMPAPNGGLVVFATPEIFAWFDEVNPDWREASNAQPLDG